MFNLLKSKAAKSAITVDLSPVECNLLQSTFEIAQKAMERTMKIDGLSDREKMVAVQRWPDQEQVYILVFSHHWAKELAKRPSSITLTSPDQCRMFINTIKLMHRTASDHARIDGTKVNLLQYSASVASVNAVIARIKAAARID
jgi:hypothetical protein